MLTEPFSPSGAPSMLTEILIVAALILVNGALSMSELAIVSARPARLKPLAENGDQGAQTALDLAGEPGRFISTVQIGITVVGVLSGAFSGATLGMRLAAWLAERGVDPTGRGRWAWAGSWCSSPICR
jgi:putative hemolysin